MPPLFTSTILDNIVLFGLLILAYVLGALPWGFWLVKWTKGIDLRTMGSGGTGATNVKRNAGWPLALLTLALDALKGAFAVWLTGFVLTTCLSTPHPAAAFWGVVAGIIAIVAHSRSVFIGFKGGKSVATSLGVFLVIEPRVMVPALAVALLTMALTRYVSLGSLMGALSCAILAFVVPDVSVVNQVVFTTVAMLLFWLHRANIQRLRQGCENKL
jgi:acyl phosphate:glycerol-3-phosphate acyltransferase